MMMEEREAGVFEKGKSFWVLPPNAPKAGTGLGVEKTTPAGTEALLWAIILGDT